MDSKTNDVKEFFDEAVKIKEQRGKNYDNGGKSAQHEHWKQCFLKRS